MTERQIGDFIRERKLTLKVRYKREAFEVSLSQGSRGAYGSSLSYEGAIVAVIGTWKRLHEGGSP